MRDNRKIIHIDMDAFYASVEQRDNKKLRNKPVVVGGNPHGRGVVCTCSYEARKYGIHSAMPCNVAYKRCPYAHFVEPRFDVYQRISNQIKNIFYRYTDLVESLSLDEAYLDVTKNKQNITYATEIAKRIKKEIYEETGLTASAGVSYNKFLAKLASDYEKPNGTTVITHENTEEFLDKLPINKFFGIGKVTEKSLRSIGIENGKDLRKLSLYQLEKVFKSRAYSMYQFARGIDNREVEPYRERKSVGSEVTLNHNLNIDDEKTSDMLDDLSKDVSERLMYNNKVGKTITLKIKYDDFTQITRSISLDNYIYKHEDIKVNVYNLLGKIHKDEKQIRLLGISMSTLKDNDGIKKSITLFDYIREL